MNADYEHALLRLLAGEGDLARIEPREVRDKLRLELESANPDVGLYRNYAACDVWVNVEDAGAPDDIDVLFEEPESWAEEFVGPSTPPAAAESRPVSAQQTEAENAGDVDSVEAEDEPPAPSRANPPFQMASESKVPTQPIKDVEEDSVSCVVCGGDLPSARIVNFCPFCGSDQSQQPCPTCGEMLEPLWRFCVACGTRVPSAGDHVN
jgi:hypothetical protein